MQNQTPEQDFGATVIAFFRRVFICDFRTERATGWESASLESQGVHHPLAQAYMAWRWPLLAVAIPFLLFHGIWELATFTWITTQISKGQDGGEAILNLLGSASFDVFDVFRILSIISILLCAIMVGVAVGMWPRQKWTRRLALIGWLVMFAAPFLLAIFPHAALMDIDRVQRELPDMLRQAQPGLTDAQLEVAAEQGAKQIKNAMGMVFGMAIALMIGPRVLGLFPGAIRSAFTMKTLLPQSQAAGWLGALTAAFWTIFLVVGLVVANQVQSSVKLVMGLLFMLMSPLVYIVWAKRYIPPCPPERLGQTIIWPRRISTLLNLAGAILLAWLFFELADSVGDVFSFIMGVIGNVLVLTVVASDFALPLLDWGFRKQKDLITSPMMPELEKRFDAFKPGRPIFQMQVMEPLASPAGAGGGVIQGTVAARELSAGAVEQVPDVQLAFGAQELHAKAGPPLDLELHQPNMVVEGQLAGDDAEPLNIELMPQDQPKEKS